MTRSIAFLMLFFSLQTEGQDLIRDYVKSNTVRLSSINPDSIDYSDLAPIGRAIGDARVVMLGEQDHGDAPTFLAKARLIKYLHEKKGFNVLAFESDFFGLNYTDTAKSVETIIKENISTIWTGCKIISPFFNHYLPAASRGAAPLRLSGFDNAMGILFLMPLLDSTIRQLKLPVTTTPEYTQELQPLLLKWYAHINDTLINNKWLALLATIKEQLLQKLPADDFWCMVADNLITQNICFQGIGEHKKYLAMMNMRDKQMALNLRWLCKKKYPAEKIIVWAHNYHVSKYGGHYKEDYLNVMSSMGSVFTGDTTLLRQTYIIGFTSYEGTAGRLSNKPQVYKVPKPLANSFENWIDPSWEYAFTDFTRYNAAHPGSVDWFNMSGAVKGNLYHTNHEAQWNRIFDGVFYIRKMYSCIGL